MGSRGVPQVVKCLHTTGLYTGCRTVLLTRKLISPNVFSYKASVANQHRLLSGDAFNLLEALKANAKKKERETVKTMEMQGEVKKKDLETIKTTEMPGEVRKKDPETSNVLINTYGNGSISDDSREKLDYVGKTDCVIHPVPAFLQAILETPFTSDRDVEIDRRAEFREFVIDLGLDCLPHVLDIIKTTAQGLIQTIERAREAKRVEERSVLEKDQFDQNQIGTITKTCLYNFDPL